MGLREQLDADLKEAMRARDRTRMDTVRQIKSTVDTEESRKGADFDDQAIEEVITRLARQHRESIEVFRQQDRAELADKEEAELALLLAYLPEQLTADDIRAMAEEAAAAVGASGPADKGKVMGQLMPKVKGPRRRQARQPDRHRPPRLPVGATLAVARSPTSPRWAAFVKTSPVLWGRSPERALAPQARGRPEGASPTPSAPVRYN